MHSRTINGRDRQLLSRTTSPQPKTARYQRQTGSPTTSPTTVSHHRRHPSYCCTPASPQETDGQKAEEVHSYHDQARESGRLADVGGLVEDGRSWRNPTGYNRNETDTRHEHNLVPRCHFRKRNTHTVEEAGGQRMAQERSVKPVRGHEERILQD